METTYQGKTLTLTQEPYIDYVRMRIGDTVEVIDGTVYRAHAVDAEDNDYEVFWTRLRDTSGGLEVADWTVYEVIG
jgi:hypothetical protein